MAQILLERYDSRAVHISMYMCSLILSYWNLVTKLNYGVGVHPASESEAKAPAGRTARPHFPGPESEWTGIGE